MDRDPATNGVSPHAVGVAGLGRRRCAASVSRFVPPYIGALARLGLIGLSLFAFLAILPEPTALTIEHHGLTFKYLLRQEHVPFTNIVAIGLSTQNGYPVIWLKLTNRKHMQLGGYAGGCY